MSATAKRDREIIVEPGRAMRKGEKKRELKHKTSLCESVVSKEMENLLHLAQRKAV